MGHIFQRIFLYPGNKVCDACHVAAGDDRILVNMLVWNLAIVIAAVAVF